MENAPRKRKKKGEKKEMKKEAAEMLTRAFSYALVAGITFSVIFLTY